MAAENKHLNRPNADQVLPIVGGAAVTPSNSTDLATLTRAIWVGGAGNLKVTTMDGSTVTLNGVQAGTLIPIRASRIWADSTATLITALY